MRHLMISPKILLLLVGLDIVYRLVVIGWDLVDAPLRDLDVFVLLGAVTIAWLIQLFVRYPSLRGLRRTRRERGIPPEGLLALLLAAVLGVSLFPIAQGVYALVTDSPLEAGKLSNGAIGSLVAIALWSLVFLIPSVRKGGIWIHQAARGEDRGAARKDRTEENRRTEDPQARRKGG